MSRAVDALRALRRTSGRTWGRSAPATTDPEPLPVPVSRERVRLFLEEKGYAFTVDEDGDLTGLWGGDRFWFLLLGARQEVLQVRGRWHAALPREGRTAVLRALNDWNRDRIWPKVYVRDEEPGLVLYAEVSFDLEHGVTDAQLHQLLICGIGTGAMVFESVSGLFEPGDAEPPPAAG